MPQPPHRTRHSLTWLLDSVLLFLIASVLIWPIYRAEYLEVWGSIESTFISDASFITNNWPHHKWQPNWYCGTRFDYIYPPALRYGTAALSRWLGVSTARSYHLYISLLYAIGIAGVYVFVRAGSGSRWVAFWVAIASALISPAFLFFENSRIDYRSFYYMPIRLGALIRYGEGPHMSALALLPFALAAAWKGIRRDYPMHLAVAAMFAALTVAHNFYGATALAILYPTLVWSVWLGEQDWRIWVRAAAVAVLASGLCAFWLTPSYVRITLANMRLVSNPGHGWSLLLGAVVIAAYAALSFRITSGKPSRSWGAFTAGALLLVGLNVLGHYYFDFRVMGEPGRLIPELDFVFLLGAGALLAWLAGRGRRWKAAAVILAILCLVPAEGYIRRAWRVLPRPATHENRIEAVLTGWVHQNLPGVRTQAAGSVRFWYNAWHDLPQLGGGSEQGLMNIQSYYAYFHAVVNENADVCVAWLKAMGVGAAIVHDKNSAEIYHDWEKPEKFEGKLEKIYDDRAGNWIYRIPRRDVSLARVVEAERMRRFPRSDAELDLAVLAAYVDVVERGPDAPVRLTRIDPESMRIQTRLGGGQLLLVQETYDPAWKAYANGRAVPIEKDPVGFMLLDPGPGDHDLLLQFETPLENRAGVAATLLSLLAIGCITVLVKASGGSTR